jgi:hypothetical protein
MDFPVIGMQLIIGTTIMESKQYKKIEYAGNVYEIIFEGERILHLRSLRDRNLVVHAPVNSSLLKELNSEEDKGVWLIK